MAMRERAWLLHRDESQVVRAFTQHGMWIGAGSNLRNAAAATPARPSALAGFGQVIGEPIHGPAPALSHPVMRGIERFALLVRWIVGRPSDGELGLAVGLLVERERRQRFGRRGRAHRVSFPEASKI